MLTSKIHRATVTQADLHYVGSVTIDADLMAAAGLLPGEQVTIVDIDNGARLVTYAIEGPAGSGVIGINGAAARLVHVGDLVILIAYGMMDDAEARTFRPRIVFVDENNRIIGTGGDPAEALPHDPSSRRGDKLAAQPDLGAPVGGALPIGAVAGVGVESDLPAARSPRHRAGAGAKL